LSATPLESLMSKKDIPAGWVLIHGPQTYTKKTLFEHIDGQAELFFKYGFQKSIFTIYQDRKNPKNQIELDIYDMGNVLQAFGIFSRFRNEDRPMGIGWDSYLDVPSAFFYMDKYFVMLYATEINPYILKQMAQGISMRILSKSLPPKEIGYFPKNRLKPGSIQYFTEGLLGHQFLKRGFSGTYIGKIEVEEKEKAEAENEECKLFLAIFKNVNEAKNGLKMFRDHLSLKGNIHSEILTLFNADAIRGEDAYRGHVIIMQKGAYLLGVVGFKKKEERESLLKEFLKNIK